MATVELVRYGIVWGSIFGAAFCGAILLLGRLNAEILLNDYPPDIRAKYGPMSARSRQQAKWASLALVVLLGSIIVWALLQLRQASGGLTLVDTFVVTLLIFQCWNLLDLVLLDWFILLTLRPRFMILPGTDDMAGYHDYRYHLRKFGSGIILMLLLSGVITILALGLEALI